MENNRFGLEADSKNGASRSSQVCRSALGRLAPELQNQIVENLLDARAVPIVKNGTSSLQYELSPQIIRTCKCLRSGPTSILHANRLVHINFRGEEQLRPAAFVPIITDKPFVQAAFSACSACVATLNVYHRDAAPLTSGIEFDKSCITTEAAACTWLAILGSQQHAAMVWDRAVPKGPSLDIRIDMDWEKGGGGSNCDVVRAIALLEQTLTGLEVRGRERIWSPADLKWTKNDDSFLATLKIRFSWLEKAMMLGPENAVLNFEEKQNHLTADLYKEVISSHRPGALISAATRMEIIRMCCVSTLNNARELWSGTVEYDARDGVEALVDWFDGCQIDRCPCHIFQAIRSDGEGGRGYDRMEHLGIPCELWADIRLTIGICHTINLQDDERDWEKITIQELENAKSKLEALNDEIHQCVPEYKGVEEDIDRIATEIQATKTDSGSHGTQIANICRGDLLAKLSLYPRRTCGTRWKVMQGTIVKSKVVRLQWGNEHELNEAAIIDYELLEHELAPTSGCTIDIVRRD